MSKSQILVVEDEPSITEILKYNLERQGYDVTTAADGPSALARAFPTWNGRSMFAHIRPVSMEARRDNR